MHWCYEGRMHAELYWDLKGEEPSKKISCIFQLHTTEDMIIKNFIPTEKLLLWVNWLEKLFQTYRIALYCAHWSSSKALNMPKSRKCLRSGWKAVSLGIRLVSLQLLTDLPLQNPELISAVMSIMSNIQQVDQTRDSFFPHWVTTLEAEMILFIRALFKTRSDKGKCNLRCTYELGLRRSPAKERTRLHISSMLYLQVISNDTLFVYLRISCNVGNVDRITEQRKLTPDMVVTSRQSRLFWHYWVVKKHLFCKNLIPLERFLQLESFQLWKITGYVRKNVQLLPSIENQFGLLICFTY